MARLIYSVLPQPRRPIAYVDPELTIAKCITLMIKNDIGALVVRDGDKILGILNERDILRSCFHNKLAPTKTKAVDIVCRMYDVLDINDHLEKAMEVITLTKRRHVLVKEKGTIVAILSIGDVLLHLLDDKAREIEHLENYIHM